jgi:hypothetical protein
MTEKTYLTVEPSKSQAGLLFERGLLAVNPSGHVLYQKLRQTARSFKIDGGGPTYYVLEGDLLLDADELYFYALQRERQEREREEREMLELVGMATERLTAGESSGLLGIVQNGNLVRWDEEMALTYCVLRKKFADTAKYRLVVANLRRAAEDWEAICNVRFEHRAELDESDDLLPEGAVFSVREVNSGGTLIAAAFFPNDPAERRRLIIDPSYYDPKLRFNKVGVLRHELGHVLGFRHEHIRREAPPECPSEDRAETVELTRYDRASVMHYFCGGVGSTDLAFTALDKIGARQLYGPPAAGTREAGLGAFETAGGGATAPAGAEDAGWEAVFSRPSRVAFVR